MTSTNNISTDNTTTATSSSTTTYPATTMPLKRLRSDNDERIAGLLVDLHDVDDDSTTNNSNNNTTSNNVNNKRNKSDLDNNVVLKQQQTDNNTILSTINNNTNNSTSTSSNGIIKPIPHRTSVNDSNNNAASNSILPPTNITNALLHSKQRVGDNVINSSTTISPSTMNSMRRIHSLNNISDMSLYEQLNTERQRADQVEQRYFDLLHHLKIICNSGTHSNNNNNDTLQKQLNNLQSILNQQMIQCETIECERKQAIQQNTLLKHSLSSNTLVQDGSHSPTIDDDNNNNNAIDQQNNNTSKRNNSYGYYCRPSRFIGHLSKEPIAVRWANVKRQYTVSKRETSLMSENEREQLMPVPVRIMGIPDDRNNLYIVAKDVCQLIHIRKANVARSIGQFSDREKARMPVLCRRSNKVDSTHVLIVLTLDGVKRLLTSSRSPLAPNVLRWLNQQIDDIIQQAENGTLDTSQNNLHEYDDYDNDNDDNEHDQDDDDIGIPGPHTIKRQQSSSPPPEMPSDKIRKQKHKKQTKSNKVSSSAMKRVKSDTKLHNIVRFEQDNIKNTNNVPSFDNSSNSSQSESPVNSTSNNSSTLDHGNNHNHNNNNSSNSKIHNNIIQQHQQYNNMFIQSKSPPIHNLPTAIPLNQHHQHIHQHQHQQQQQHHNAIPYIQSPSIPYIPIQQQQQDNRIHQQYMQQQQQTMHPMYALPINTHHHTHPYTHTHILDNKHHMYNTSTPYIINPSLYTQYAQMYNSNNNNNNSNNNQIQTKPE